LVAAVADLSHAADVLLRTAELADLPALIEVQHAGSLQALTHIFPQDAHPFPRAAIQARWAAEIADPAVKVYVIEQAGGRLGGFAAIRDHELLHFGTAVETWGSGLAAAAHNQLMEWLAATGATRAELRVFEENHRARRFYEKLGWRRTDRISRTSFPPHPVLVSYEFDLRIPAG
jgi:RimJ/RimL family protein N-acetyltransferase